MKQKFSYVPYSTFLTQPDPTHPSQGPRQMNWNSSAHHQPVLRSGRSHTQFSILVWPHLLAWLPTSRLLPWHYHSCSPPPASVLNLQAFHGQYFNFSAQPDPEHLLQDESARSFLKHSLQLPQLPPNSRLRLAHTCCTASPLSTPNFIPHKSYPNYRP